MNTLPTSADADRRAAHELLTELRTRITTQPLPYQFGVEARALESLWEVFGHARTAMKNNPGCAVFARKATDTLNVSVRPFTAKWHRAFAEGRLGSRDGADAFRGELKGIQEALRFFASELHQMAYGNAGADRLTEPAISDKEIAACLEPLPFGIVPSPALTDTGLIAAMNESERAEILRRRHGPGVQANAAASDAVGLALSGGGIRSATFSLGVVQALAERGLLAQVDFLSTVSGGGYAGSFLTRRLGDPEIGNDQSRVDRPQGPDPESIRYVRQHAEYLSPTTLWDSWGMVTGTLAGMILNAAVPLLGVLLVSLLVRIVGPRWEPEFWPWILGSSAGLCAVGLIAYGILLNGSREALRAGGWILGSSVAIAVGSLAGWVLQEGFHVLPGKLREYWAVGGGLGALVALVPWAIRWVPVAASPAVRAVLLRLLLVLAALIVPLLAVLLLYLFCYLGGLTPDSLLPAESPGSPWLLAAIGIPLAFVAIAVLDVNRTSPHRLYRNRLAKTFVSRHDKDEGNVPLSGVNASGRAPYHLVNTTLNVPASASPFLRDRKCDFFLFSKHWSGSPSTGYWSTERCSMHASPVDLATVMAISGAAASSHMGLLSVPTVTALLTILNVRLGYWLRRPDSPDPKRRPGFLCLFREMTGMGMSENASWLNLSDGGHVENTGVYELLRRRCKFIVAVDAEADPGFLFPGLMTLVRHARIDFGIRIQPDLDPLRPDSKTRLSPAHAVLCRIHYPAVQGVPEGTGLLLYLKLSVTGNESELIHRYRARHASFPHQSTADQFFDQEQFEAYRQLGAHAVEGLFASALMNSNPAVTSKADIEKRCRPATIRQWFQQLAESLLNPVETDRG